MDPVRHPLSLPFPCLSSSLRVVRKLGPLRGVVAIASMQRGSVDAAPVAASVPVPRSRPTLPWPAGASPPR